MPAIRATRREPLSLDLLVLGITGADHPHFAFALDDDALFADSFDGRSDFHTDDSLERSFAPVRVGARSDPAYL